MSPLLRVGFACTQARICSHCPANGSLLVRLQSRILGVSCFSWGSSSASLASWKTSSAAHPARSNGRSSGIGYRLADGGSPSFTAKGRLLQVFHLLEEPKGVKHFPDCTQFLLLGSGQHSRGQNPLQRRFGRVVDPMDRSSLNLFRN